MEGVRKRKLFIALAAAAFIAPSVGLGAASGLVAQGKAIYEKECQGCHLDSGKGAGKIPDIRGLSAQALAQSDCGKVNKKPKDELEALGAYLMSLDRDEP